MCDIPIPVENASGDKPARIVVELISSADVKRLESRDEDIRCEVQRLRGEVEGLRRSFYELLETIGDIRHSRSEKK